MTQIELTTPGDLLDSQGNLCRPGYSRRELQRYDRRAIHASPLRIKEWDYYLISNGRFALALTVADNGYMGLDSVSFLALEEGWEITKSKMQVMPLGRKALPADSRAGDVHSTGRSHSLHFLRRLGARELIAQMADFGPEGPLYARVTLTHEPEESILIATPFAKPGHFYYNQKINCLRARGYVTYGSRTWEFDPADSFAVLDWGRGVWTYENTWYWSSVSAPAPDGVPFGWNLGYGFGDTSAATENMLFYGGRGHKLDQVRFEIPGEGAGTPRFMDPWHISSPDGRLEAEFRPVMDRAADMNFQLLRSDQHQVFGRFTGRAVLDDGQEIHFRDLPGFAEKVYNKW